MRGDNDGDFWHKVAMMSDEFADLDTDLSDHAPGAWRKALDAIGDELGYCASLGTEHAALFIDGGPRLLVTFESRDSVMKRPRALPRGFDLVRKHGWSLLALISDGNTWFRDPAVYGFIDRLLDDGFFEDFDQVLFFGSGAAGYAATAFSVAAPGAQVLAIRPQATLDPDITGWDRRYITERRRDFTSRYGYGPEMIEAAGMAFLVFDPTYAPDAMHTALYGRTNVTPLRCPQTGLRIEDMLDLMDLTTPLIEQAMAGSLTGPSFALLWRARRDSPAYLRSLLKKAEVAGRTSHVIRICQHGLQTRHQSFFARRLQEIGAQIPKPMQAAQ